MLTGRFEIKKTWFGPRVFVEENVITRYGIGFRWRKMQNSDILDKNFYGKQAGAYEWADRTCVHRLGFLFPEERKLQRDCRDWGCQSGVGPKKAA